MTAAVIKNPVLNPAVLLAPVENGYIAYNPETHCLHQLNPVAALITELCDGRNNTEQLRNLLTPFFPEGERGAVAQWICEAVKKELLTFSDGPFRAPRELSAAQLAKLARRLQTEGDVLTALLCQKRVCELTPGVPQHWLTLGEMAHINGRRDEARLAYEKYLEFHPDDAEIDHLLIALRSDQAPPRMSDKCVKQLYSRFSSFYEDNLCHDLDYRAPERLEQLIEPFITGRSNLKLLDLGCGTGLAGDRFSAKVASMTGVDLSPEMLAIAEKRNIYQRLENAEITQWLNRTKTSGEKFDLIIASDSLIYFGDMNIVFAHCSEILNDGGVFAFTLESGDQHPWKLNDSGRYSHHIDYIRDLCVRFNLQIEHIEQNYLRMEYGSEVTGLFVILAAA